MVSRIFFIAAAFFGPSFSVFFNWSSDAFRMFFGVLIFLRRVFASVGPMFGRDSIRCSCCSCVVNVCFVGLSENSFLVSCCFKIMFRREAVSSVFFVWIVGML